MSLGLRAPIEPHDMLDPRQREAAALLLSACDLPAPADQVAKLWIKAARVSPGITADKVFVGDRTAQLTRARDLIDQILKELTNGKA